MKSKLFLFMIVGILMLNVGCTEKLPDVAVYDIVSNIEAAVPDLVGMDKIDLVTETGTTEMLGLNLDDIQEGLMLRPGMSIGAMEVIVIRTKDVKSAENLKTSLEGHIEQLKQSFGGYGAEEMKKIEDSILKTNSNYVLYVVLAEPYPSQVEDAFDKSLQTEK